MPPRPRCRRWSPARPASPSCWTPRCRGPPCSVAGPTASASNAAAMPKAQWTSPSGRTGPRCGWRRCRCRAITGCASTPAAAPPSRRRWPLRRRAATRCPMRCRRAGARPMRGCGAAPRSSMACATTPDGPPSRRVWATTPRPACWPAAWPSTAPMRWH
ncbi:Hypothetical Protein RRSL_03724 [Ralstonia solanacearum UW551]|uniref:Uncharacterized protein n=1 Tax=Ralstonia solanacearum (strain UW551) TaxID=342110 RepID=A0AB33VH78_RALSU|nr:Hypothetical Protein RRSL_03724 [Ralstonia solanacearum UW551]